MSIGIAILEGLSRAGVRFVVVGGVAASVHGSARVTLDLDICYDPDRDNVRRLADVLAGWHAYLRGVEPGLPFAMDERMLHNTPVMTLVTDHGSLDVMDRVLGVGAFDKVLEASIAASAGGTTFRVLDLPALLAAKRATGRRKDVDQIPELEALLETRRRRKRRR